MDQGRRPGLPLPVLGWLLVGALAWGIVAAALVADGWPR